jgi:hypothetical protein
MPEPIITKEKIVVVASREENQYGAILFTDKEGNNYKISEKRKELGNQIIKDYAVKLKFAAYMGKEYIAGAELVKDNLPPPAKPQAMPTSVQSNSTPVKPPTPTLTQVAQEMNRQVDSNEIKNRAVALAYAKDLVVGGKIVLEDVEVTADKFLKYIKGV